MIRRTPDVFLGELTIKDVLSDGVFKRMGYKLRDAFPQLQTPESFSGDIYAACLLELRIKDKQITAVYGLFKVFTEGWG